ncbi:globin-like protein [Mariannaea sp. PMI_226]|nr:globin-like protein [Mariannaea sp. PMI_226]
MALSYKQVQLVKGTIPALREQGETITTIFYETLLRDHPELNNVFNRVNMINGRQPRALCRVIIRFASNIHNISELIPQLERTCNKHCSLGVEPEHYEVVAAYLISAFGDVLGDAMTEDIRDAWVKAYYVLARMLTTREAQIYGVYRWPGWRKFRIDRKVAESENVCSFYLVAHDRKPIPTFLPGQYVSVSVHLPELGHDQARQYSLSDAPGKYYRITVKRDEGASRTNAASMRYHNPGVVSTMLLDLPVGSTVSLSNPSGEFCLDPTASSVPLVFASADIGIAPLMAMVNAALQIQPNRCVSWAHISSERTPPFHRHMEKLAKKCPNLTVANRFEEQDLFLDKGATEYYVCGPEGLVSSILQRFAAAGVPEDRMFLEIFQTGDGASVPEKGNKVNA